MVASFFLFVKSVLPKHFFFVILEQCFFKTLNSCRVGYDNFVLYLLTVSMFPDTALMMLA